MDTEKGACLLSDEESPPEELCFKREMRDSDCSHFESSDPSDESKENNCGSSSWDGKDRDKLWASIFASVDGGHTRIKGTTQAFSDQAELKMRPQIQDNDNASVSGRSKKLSNNFSNFI